MSGGSYGYLEGVVSMGLFEDAIDRTHLAAMYERLDGLPWASTAARDLRAVIEAATTLDNDLKQLADVFHAIEWWDSNDWFEDQAREVVNAYEQTPDGGT